tara:strand:+ start:779 stop:1078 length:300 start_codon:yes stop_codon:yes gene_type:complete
MIDTSKYEGHSPAPWQPWKNKRTIEVVRSQLAEKPVVCKVLNECDAQLIADAPLLLAEVKRLRERLDLAERYIIEPTLTRNYFADVVSKGLDDERDNLG